MGRVGLQPATDLDAGLLIGTEHVLIRPEWPALPLTGVQIQHRAGQLQKVPSAWEDPGPIPPGTQGVVSQQAPDGRARGREFLTWETVGNFDHEFTQAVATERHRAISGTFASQRHHQRTRRGVDRFRSTTARSIPQPIAALGGKPAKPAPNGGSAHPLLARQRPTAQPSGTAQDQTRSSRQTLGRGASAYPGGQLANFSSSQFHCGGRPRHEQLLGHRP
jgi:hypothetical protein